jgi:hypothetical protein
VEREYREELIMNVTAFIVRDWWIGSRERT